MFITLALPMVLLSAASATDAADTRSALVLLSDFGTSERFVASMKGVALSVDPQLQIHDLTHHIEPFNFWQASYTLAGTIDCSTQILCRSSGWRSTPEISQSAYGVKAGADWTVEVKRMPAEEN